MNDLGRLRWRCRRGMKELDVLLARYVDEHFGAAPVQEQQAFEQLLDAPDPLLYAYFVAQEPPPVHLRPLIERIAGR